MAREATMTRKHFEMIGDIINTLNVDPDKRQEIARDFARVFEGVNSAFVTALFINHATRTDLKKATKRAGQHVAHRASDPEN